MTTKELLAAADIEGELENAKVDRDACKKRLYLLFEKYPDADTLEEVSIAAEDVAEDQALFDAWNEAELRVARLESRLIELGIMDQSQRSNL